MNQPQFPPGQWPQQPQQPQQWQQPAPQPQYPQAPPQQGYPQQPQQHYPQQPQQHPGQQPIAAGVATNLFQQFLAGPPKERANRARPPDGTHVVRIEGDSQYKYSQKDGRSFILISYTVLESTVPQCVGQKFSYPVFWTSRSQLEELAELSKWALGPPILQQLAASGQGSPDTIAQAILQQSIGKFCKLVTRRSQKQINAGIPYDQMYVNHDWSHFNAQQVSLATVSQMPTSGVAAQMPMHPMPGQAPAMAFPPQGQPQQPQQPMQQQAQAAQAPAMWVPPAAPQQAPQQAPPQQAWPQQQQQPPAAPPQQAWQQAPPQAPPQQAWQQPPPPPQQGSFPSTAFPPPR